MRRFLFLTPILLIAGGLYWYTMLPHTGFSADTTKFQYIGYTLSTPHETGYPLYTLLTYLFTHLLPIGRVAWRANLFSGVCTLTGLLLFYGVLRRIEIRPIVALIATLFLAITPTLWMYSLVAEVYTLNFLCLIGTVYCLVSWRKTAQDRYFYLFALIYALSFGNHMSMILLLPAILFYVCVHDWRVLITPRKIVWVLFCIALGAGSYLYIVQRSFDPTTPYLEAAITNVESFIQVVTGRRFGNFMFAYTPQQLLTERIPQFRDIFLKEFKLFWLFVMVGLFTLRNWRTYGLLLIWLLGYTVYTLNYAIPDINPYLIPGFVAFALFAAVGIDRIVGWLGRLRPNIAKVAIPIALLLTLALVGWQTDRSYPHVSQRTNQYYVPEGVLEKIEDNSVVILPNVFDAHFFWYYLFAEGLDQRNIYAVFDDGFSLSPADAIAYLGGASDLDSPFIPALPPRGLTLYCYTAFANCDRYINEPQLAHEKIKTNLYRLTISQTSTPTPTSYTIMMPVVMKQERFYDIQ